MQIEMMGDFAGQLALSDGLALQLSPAPGLTDAARAPRAGLLARPALGLDGGALSVSLPLGLPDYGADVRRFTLSAATCWTQTQHYVNSLTGFDVTLSAEPALRRIEATVTARVGQRRAAIYRGAFDYAECPPPGPCGGWDEIDPRLLQRLRDRREGAQVPLRDGALNVSTDAAGLRAFCAVIGAPGFVGAACAALRRLAEQLGLPAAGAVLAIGSMAARGGVTGYWVAGDGAAGWFEDGATPEISPPRGLFAVGRRRVVLCAFRGAPAARTLEGMTPPAEGLARFVGPDGRPAGVALVGGGGFAGLRPDFAATVAAWTGAVPAAA